MFFVEVFRGEKLCCQCFKMKLSTNAYYLFLNYLILLLLFSKLYSNFKRGIFYPCKLNCILDKFIIYFFC